MKNVKMVLMAMIIGLSTLSCQTENEKNEAKLESNDILANNQKILQSYLKLKDALVETNGEKANSMAKELINLLNSEDELIQKIKTDANKIAETADVNQQREYFNGLSDNVYTLLKSASANDNAIYRQYCPMAFDNKGAYWLSAEQEVNNPYFGDQMLHCGTVKEEL